MSKVLTEKQISKLEYNSYVIAIGNDFYGKDGQYVFSMSQAENHYDTLLDNILNTMENGTVKQKLAAEKCLLRLHILPFKIQ